MEKNKLIANVLGHLETQGLNTEGTEIILTIHDRDGILKFSLDDNLYDITYDVRVTIPHELTWYPYGTYHPTQGLSCDYHYHYFYGETERYVSEEVEPYKEIWNEVVNKSLIKQKLNKFVEE